MVDSAYPTALDMLLDSVERQRDSAPQERALSSERL
jgi:hypothetical protein